MLYVLRAAINVSVALNRRGMRHKSNIQSSGGWRQPTLSQASACILYGPCTCHHRLLNRLEWGSTRDRRSTGYFYFIPVCQTREARKGELRRTCGASLCIAAAMRSAKDSHAVLSAKKVLSSFSRVLLEIMFLYIRLASFNVKYI